MKRIFARIAALCMVALAGVTATGCTFETSDWWDQLTCGDHTYEEKEVTKQATCAEEGEVLKVCADCGKEKTFKIEKTEHITEKVAGKAATCTDAGYTEGEKCVVCDEWVTAPEALPALGHDVVEDEAIEAEDCQTPGLTAGSHCKTCGTVLEAQEEVLGTHVDEANDGTCDVCQESIFADATFAKVKVGDAAEGWYRAKYVESVPDEATGGYIFNKIFNFTIDHPSNIVIDDPEIHVRENADFSLKLLYDTMNQFGDGSDNVYYTIDLFASESKEVFLGDVFCTVSVIENVDGYTYFYIHEYEFDIDHSEGSATATVSGFKFTDIQIDIEKVIFE